MVRLRFQLRGGLQLHLTVIPGVYLRTDSHFLVVVSSANIQIGDLRKTKKGYHQFRAVTSFVVKLRLL